MSNRPRNEAALKARLAFIATTSYLEREELEILKDAYRTVYVSLHTGFIPTLTMLVLGSLEGVAPTYPHYEEITPENAVKAVFEECGVGYDVPSIVAMDDGQRRRLQSTLTFVLDERVGDIRLAMADDFPLK